MLWSSGQHITIYRITTVVGVGAGTAFTVVQALRDNNCSTSNANLPSSFGALNPPTHFR
jgi:hypothetical protein